MNHRTSSSSERRRPLSSFHTFFSDDTITPCVIGTVRLAFCCRTDTTVQIRFSQLSWSITSLRFHKLEEFRIPLISHRFGCRLPHLHSYIHPAILIRILRCLHVHSDSGRLHGKSLQTHIITPDVILLDEEKDHMALLRTSSLDTSQFDTSAERSEVSLEVNALDHM